MHKVLTLPFLASLISTTCFTTTTVLSMDVVPSDHVALKKTTLTFPTPKERDFWIQFTSERLTAQIFDVVPDTPINIEELPSSAREALDQFGKLFAGEGDFSSKEEKIRAYALTNPFFASLVVDASFNHELCYELETQSPVFYGNSGRLKTLLAIGECYPYLTNVGDVLADFYTRAYQGTDRNDIIVVESAPDFNPSKIKTNILRELKSLEPKSTACSCAYTALLLKRIQIIQLLIGDYRQILNRLDELVEAVQEIPGPGKEAYLSTIADRRLTATENLKKSNDQLQSLRAQLFAAAEKYPARQQIIFTQDASYGDFLKQAPIDILQGLESQGWDPHTLAYARLFHNPQEALTDSPAHQKALSVFTIQALLNGSHNNAFGFDTMGEEKRAQLFNHHLRILNNMEESDLVSAIKADAHVSMAIARIKVYQEQERKKEPTPKDLRMATLFASLPKDGQEETRNSLRTLINYASHGHDHAGEFLLKYLKDRLKEEKEPLDNYNRTSQIFAIARTYLMMLKGGALTEE